jgi:hypothetical protein
MSSIIWDITPCSLLKVYRRFGGICRLHLQGQVYAEQQISMKAGAYTFTLKMEATYSPETSVHFKRTRRRHIPEDKTLMPVNL